MLIVTTAIFTRSCCYGGRRFTIHFQTVHAGRADPRPHFLYRRKDWHRHSSTATASTSIVVEWQIDHRARGTIGALLHTGDATPAVGRGTVVDGPVQQRLDALPVHKVAGVEGQAEAQDVSGQDGPELPQVLGAVDVVGRNVEAQDERDGDEDEAADGVEHLDGEGDAVALVLVVEHPRQGVGWAGRVDVDGVGIAADEQLQRLFFDDQFFADGGVVSVGGACCCGRHVLIGRHRRRRVRTCRRCGRSIGIERYGNVAVVPRGQTES